MAGLFAGIGGIELEASSGLWGDGVETTLLCRWWEPKPPAFPRGRTPSRCSIEFSRPDVRRGLRARIYRAWKGPPVSQGQIGPPPTSSRIAVRTGPPALLIENVPVGARSRGRATGPSDRGVGEPWLSVGLSRGRFALHRGAPTAPTGVAPRLLPTEDHRPVLRGGCRGLDEGHLDDTIFGFYWTEGRGGLGWALGRGCRRSKGIDVDAIAAAIWVSDSPLDRTFIRAGGRRRAVTGFRRGWDVVDRMPRSHGHRWKLIGNAVTRARRQVGGRSASRWQAGLCSMTGCGPARARGPRQPGAEQPDLAGRGVRVPAAHRTWVSVGGRCGDCAAALIDRAISSSAAASVEQPRSSPRLGTRSRRIPTPLTCPVSTLLRRRREYCGTVQ